MLNDPQKETPAPVEEAGAKDQSSTSINIKNFVDKSRGNALLYKDLFANQPKPSIRDEGGRFVSDWGPYATAVALAHAAHGLRVHPLRPCTKDPAIRAWPERATTDTGLIRHWWQKDHEGECDNIGIECDELLDVDLDVKKRPLAEVKNDLEERCGALPKTWVMLTPSGGEQYFYKLPPGVRVGCSTNAICPDVDIKSWHGNAVAPGSYTTAKIEGGKQVRWAGLLSLGRRPLA